jgi:hypothetical protein
MMTNIPPNAPGHSCEVYDGDESPYVLHQSQCNRCLHRWPLREGPMRCMAYPQGIPLALWTNGVDHRDPYPGDRGIRFYPWPPVRTDEPL